MRKTLIQTLLAAFCAILATAPLEGGGVMLINMRNALLSGGKKWKNPYPIMDSCVFFIDGEWNAGGGKHNTDNSRIIDLVSGRSVDISGKNAFVGDNYITFPQDANAEYAAFDTQIEFMADKVCTMETVWSTSYHNIGQTQSLVSVSIGIITTQYGFKTVFCPEKNGTTTGYVPGGSKLSLLTISNFVGVFRGGGLASHIYTNGKYKFDVYGNKYGTTINYADTTVSLFYNKQCSMTLNSIRIHSRALTAAEIAANYAVDKARFNLPDAT